MKKENFVETAWMLGDDEMCHAAYEAGLSYEEYRSYRNGLKLLGEQARVILIGLYPDCDVIYESQIKKTVGEKAFQCMRRFNLIETCAMFDGDRLYAI